MSQNMSSLTRRVARALRPLRVAEARQAKQIAVDYLRPELERDRESRFRVVGAEMTIARPKHRTAMPPRYVEVFVIDYLNRRQRRVVVEGTRVVEVRELEGQPAFSAEEIAEAKAIASSAPALRKLGIWRRKPTISSIIMPSSRSPRAGLQSFEAGLTEVPYLLCMNIESH